LTCKKALSVCRPCILIGEIIDRSAQLARAFRERGLPVVLVNVSGMAPGRTDAGMPKFSFPPDWTELVPELEQHPGDSSSPSSDGARSWARLWMIPCAGAA
jgi:nicotinamidase-related amidase